jgi:hypothetical protein
MRMRHAGVPIPKPDAFHQLTAEKCWLRGETPKSILAPRKNWNPPLEWIDIAERIEKVLAHRDLANFLRVLEKHNSNRVTPFLLGPYLFHVIHSVEARKDYFQMMPALGRRPAELRAHLQAASAKAKTLARLVRKGPQPLIALAARDEVSEEGVNVFQPCGMIQSPHELETIVPLNWLLENAAATLDSVAKEIPRATRHQKPASKAVDSERRELRRRGATVLATTFRREFNHFYHSHVATIVTVLTGIETDADHVKKVEKRERRAAAMRGQKS